MDAFVINMDSRKDRLEAFNRNQLPFDVKRISGVPSIRGEDGCTASHLRTIRSCDKFPFVVFEDDCIMLQPWSVVSDCIGTLPKGWDALWLGATLTEKLVPYSDKAFSLKKAYCLHAVIYNSRRMIDFIVKNHNTPSGKNLDIFYFNKVLDKFNCFITNPICATQSEGFSDISLTKTGSWIIEDSYKRLT